MLFWPGRYQEVAENLEVKEVVISDRRCVICRNPQKAKKDAVVRGAILSKLEQTLSTQGQKSGR